MTSRAGRRRLCGAVLLAAVATSGVAVARGGDPRSPTPFAVARAATPAPSPSCVLGLVCPTPTASHATPRPSHSSTATPAATPTPAQSSAGPTPTDVPTDTFTFSLPPAPDQPVVLPTLPAESPSPGSPPQPPDLEVQAVLLVAAGGDTVRSGVSVLVEATCTARRGTDTYAVPHAKVSFSLSAPAGSTASVQPAQADSGDTGIATVSLDAGDVPGDLVLAATSGSAGGQLTLHVAGDLGTPTATPTATPVAALPASTNVVEGGGTTGGRAVAVALLVALGAAVLATTLLRLELLPRLGPRRRRPAGSPDAGEEDPGADAVEIAGGGDGAFSSG